MSYEVLARRLRPGGFGDLIGQDHVVRALTNALDADRLHHAYLFTGTRGVGKTTIARILAKCLNCEAGVSSSPCGTCSVCMEIKENRFMDLIEVDAASRTGVDDTRDLLENAQYMPTRGRYKVYLIDEVHMLSTASFNALLKTLEEPPGHVKFLLATTDPKKVPATVLSRCLQFQLKNLSRDAIRQYLVEVLERDSIEHEVEALGVIAENAAGSMRDALSLTDQAIAYGDGKILTDDVVAMLGVVGRDQVGAVLAALARRSAADLLSLSAELAERNADFVDVLRGLVQALHEQSVACALGRTAEAMFSAEELQLFYQIALMGYRDIHIVPDERSGFEMTLIRMLTFAPDAAAPPDPSARRRKTAPAATTDTPASPQPAAPGEQKEQTEQADWYAIVSTLSIGGVARMIAEHSVVTRFDLPRITLMLDQDHDTLLSDAQEQTLARGLEEVIGREISLTIETGTPGRETPSVRNARLAAERQQAAEAAIEEDVTVKTLLAEFGGRLDEVRPR